MGIPYYGRITPSSAQQTGLEEDFCIAVPYFSQTAKPVDGLMITMMMIDERNPNV
ncbi:hypothetical protein DPMN_180667 [Dreissena polymorpha]|uniref:Uncharacterized protein n=1 Tax=Dreissena polymorpha TaxID=45954 RepID=A0A9D4EIH2_DREPO|nr:hypothetical protein DPMN_180667 [Dreissena polymorpha]